MSKKQLIDNIKSVEKVGATSKIQRMLQHPLKYIYAILFREVFYKKNKQETEVRCVTFFNTPMHILLPSSTDIYLTGGKSHNSEIRLAKFLINQLNPNDTFLDVGAHYGYFTLLASLLVGNRGKVYSFEASPTTYNILSKNVLNIEQITSYNCAVSDEKTNLTFYEFPNLYSEYNALDVTQFENEDWFAEYKPKEIKIQSIVLDEFITNQHAMPSIIKIDVEGAEYKVIKGLKHFLEHNAPIIVLEYLSDERINDEHKKAEELLYSLQYQPYIIDSEGGIKQTQSISNYLQSQKLDSENILFIKK
jgi:FkbM family methyltransferase